MARHADRMCRLITGYGLILGADELIQLSTNGVGQHADSYDVSVEVLHDAPFLTDRCLDDRSPQV
jgi:hypothetical protein